MSKITALLPRLYLPLLLLLTAAYAWRPLEGGYDFWAHAAIGRWIESHARVPRTNLFLLSEPNFPWVAHSWLSQLFFYNLLERGGLLAVMIFNVVLPLAVFFLLWRVWKQSSPVTFLTPLFFAIAIWVSAPRFQPRQELISALFLTVLLAFLTAFAQGRFDDWLRRRDGVNLSLIAAPLVTLFFLWVNLHALVAVGLAMLWIAALAELLQTHLSKSVSENRGRARALLAVAVLCTLATLLNPYGIAYWKAAEVLKPNGQARYVQEWLPFWKPPAMSWSYPIVEIILFLGALGAWLSNPAKRWAHIGWLLFAATIFVGSRRMLWIAAIIFLIVMAANARALDTPTLWRSWRRMVKGNMLEPIPDAMRLVARAGVLLTLIIWLVTAASRHTPAEAGAWNTYVRNVPEGAARRIMAMQSPDTLRIFNDYEDSSYLHWRMNGYMPDGSNVPARGRYPLFTDLLNAYPDRLMDEYLTILDGKPEGIKYFNRRKINLVVLGDHRWTVKRNGRTEKLGLVKYLERPNSGWRQIFQDKQSIIWIKNQR